MRMVSAAPHWSLTSLRRTSWGKLPRWGRDSGVNKLIAQESEQRCTGAFQAPACSRLITLGWPGKKSKTIMGTREDSMKLVVGYTLVCYFLFLCNRSVNKVKMFSKDKNAKGRTAPAASLSGSTPPRPLHPLSLLSVPQTCLGREGPSGICSRPRRPKGGLLLAPNCSRGSQRPREPEGSWFSTTLLTRAWHEGRAQDVFVDVVNNVVSLLSALVGTS